MARDDWRIRIELEGDRADGFLERLGPDLGPKAGGLAKGIEVVRLPVSRYCRTIVGCASSEDEAKALARQLHGEVEAGGEVVWEVMPRNPFAVFGGIGS